MKRTILSLSILGLLCLGTQSANAAWDVVYLNPLQYAGIGPNYTSFSLNPMTGFRNCNPCPLPERCNKCEKVKTSKCDPCKREKRAKCHECTTGAAAPTMIECPTCKKRF